MKTNFNIHSKGETGWLHKRSTSISELFMGYKERALFYSSLMLHELELLMYGLLIYTSLYG